MFTDIVRSTEHAARLGDRRWHDLMADHDRLMHDQIAVYRGRTIRSTGDGVFAAFDGPARAIRCALAAVQAAQALDVDIRAGLHTGECQLAGDDLAGVTVHIGARIADLAEPSQVLVSGTVRDLVVGSNIGVPLPRRRGARGRARRVAPVHRRRLSARTATGSSKRLARRRRYCATGDACHSRAVSELRRQLRSLGDRAVCSDDGGAARRARARSRRRPRRPGPCRPGTNRPSRIAIASGSTSRFWITRLSGRAPYVGS